MIINGYYKISNVKIMETKSLSQPKCLEIKTVFRQLVTLR